MVVSDGLRKLCFWESSHPRLGQHDFYIIIDAQIYHFFFPYCCANVVNLYTSTALLVHTLVMRVYHYYRRFLANVCGNIVQKAPLFCLQSILQFFILMHGRSTQVSHCRDFGGSPGTINPMSDSWAFDDVMLARSVDATSMVKQNVMAFRPIAILLCKMLVLNPLYIWSLFPVLYCSG